MKCMHTLLTASLALTFAGLVQATVPAADAAKLGANLTAVGAEKAGNADGSIPAYTGGLTSLPAGFKAGDTFARILTPARSRCWSSMARMSLSAGQLAAVTVELATRFPSFRVEVYPTHRSVALPQSVLDNTIKNATGAKSLEGGNAIENVLPGVPFPIPQSGAEAMWNHLLRYQGVAYSTKYDSWNVDSSGAQNLATSGEIVNSFPIFEDPSKVIDGKDTYFQTRLFYTGPARRAGEAMMLKDAANPLVQARRAWQYLPGQRRVKLAPTLAYDTPNPGTAGSSTYDDAYVFNGALDRYDWKLVGKQEMIVPYNTYALSYIKDPKALTTPNHLAPQFVRWEKHRVWVVEGTLKPGARHVYAKRRFYLDEDSWVALASDQYDARGQLYRGSFSFLSQSYDVTTPNTTPHVIYDLVGGTLQHQRFVGPLRRHQIHRAALQGAVVAGCAGR